MEESEMRRKYFDAAATTPLDSEVREEMVANFHNFGNENVPHFCGQKARKKMDFYMEKIADCLKISSKNIFIMYSATDCNRRTVQSAQAQFGKENCFCSNVEHSSVSNQIASNLRFLPREINGECVFPNGEALKNPIFLALMAASAETGSIFNGTFLRNKFPDALILRDFAQSYAKYEIPDFENCDAGTFAPQKIYGPKMIGLLYLKNPEKFPEIANDKSTKNLFLVAGMAKAFELFEKNRAADFLKAKRWSAQIEDCIRKIPNSKILDEENPRITGLISASFENKPGYEIAQILSNQGFSVSTKSPGSSKKPTPMIQSCTNNPKLQMPIRIGIHKFLEDEAVTDFCQVLEVIS
jgi:cysteine desulfurase